MAALARLNAEKNLGRGGDQREQGSNAELCDLEDLGVTKKQSHNWQKVAASLRDGDKPAGIVALPFRTC
jgi:hypothetical protein